jgi:hypothetical protein
VIVCRIAAPSSPRSTRTACPPWRNRWRITLACSIASQPCWLTFAISPLPASIAGGSAGGTTSNQLGGRRASSATASGTLISPAIAGSSDTGRHCQGRHVACPTLGLALSGGSPSRLIASIIDRVIQRRIKIESESVDSCCLRERLPRGVVTQAARCAAQPSGPLQTSADGIATAITFEDPGFGPGLSASQRDDVRRPPGAVCMRRLHADEFGNPSSATSNPTREAMKEAAIEMDRKRRRGVRTVKNAADKTVPPTFERRKVEMAFKQP